MITDVYGKSKITELDRKKLPSHWNYYFEYEIDSELSTLTRNEFINVINVEKKLEKPLIYSQVIIPRILRIVDTKHHFHKKFREKHTNLDSEQTLGMQLYHIFIQDEGIWKYGERKEKDLLFSHAVYFK